MVDKNIDRIYFVFFLVSFSLISKQSPFMATSNLLSNFPENNFESFICRQTIEISVRRRFCMDNNGAQNRGEIRELFKK